jgi:hypothetical protein
MPIRAISDVGASNDDILQSIRFAAGPSNAGGTVPPQKADIINLSLTLSRLWRLAKSNQAAVERGGSRPGDVVMSSLPNSRDRIA